MLVPSDANLGSVKTVLDCTWYVNTPWCDVLINKVFSTFPTTRARNTTSNDVFPPGGITCKDEEKHFNSKHNDDWRRTANQLHESIYSNKLQHKRSAARKTLQLCAKFSILVLQRVTAQWFCVHHHKGTRTSYKNTTASCLLLLVETTSMTVHLYKTTKKENCPFDVLKQKNCLKQGIQFMFDLLFSEK